MFLDTLENKIQNDDKYMHRQSVDNSLKNTKIDNIHTILSSKPDALSEDALISLLKSKDLYICLKSCSLLTKLYRKKDHRNEYLIFFKNRLIENNSYDELNQLLVFFIDFISCKSSTSFDLNRRKKLICEDECLHKIFKSLINIHEVQYNILLILYTLSFDTNYLGYIYSFIDNIIHIIKERIREKILRVSYNVIINLLKSGYPLSINKIYELRRVTQTLCESKFSDTDLLSSVKEALVYLNQQHSKYDIHKYVEDLFKGNLEDSDYHYDVNFWMTGLPVIQKNKVEIIKVLKKYLKSHNTNWICLACNDIYMLVKVYPEINHLLTKYKVRDILFDLTRSENDDTRFQAVKTLYSCIFSEWT